MQCVAWPLTRYEQNTGYRFIVSKIVEILMASNSLSNKMHELPTLCMRIKPNDGTRLCDLRFLKIAQDIKHRQLHKMSRNINSEVLAGLMFPTKMVVHLPVWTLNILR